MPKINDSMTSLMRQIESKHAEIDFMIDALLKWHDKLNPNENSLIRTINHAKYEYLAHSPEHRRIMAGG